MDLENKYLGLVVAILMQQALWRWWLMAEVFVWRYVLYIFYIQSLPRSIQKSQPCTRRPPRKVDSAMSRGNVWERGNDRGPCKSISKRLFPSLRGLTYGSRISNFAKPASNWFKKKLIHSKSWQNSHNKL